MPSNDLHDWIEDIEARIESLGETAERCRKFILLSKAATTVGGVLLSVNLAGVIRPDLPTMLFAIAMLLGGIVWGGSNWSTMRRTEGEKRAAEELRVEMINEADLPFLGQP